MFRWWFHSPLMFVVTAPHLLSAVFPVPSEWQPGRLSPQSPSPRTLVSSLSGLCLHETTQSSLLGRRGWLSSFSGGRLLLFVHTNNGCSARTARAVSGVRASVPPHFLRVRQDVVAYRVRRRALSAGLCLHGNGRRKAAPKKEAYCAQR